MGTTAIATRICQARRVEALLLRATYKPGTRFRLFPKSDVQSGWPSDCFMLYITVKMPSLDSSGEMIDITTPVSFESDRIEAMSDEQICRTVFDNIVSLERHEATEWFKVDGLNLVDPHPELKAQR